MSGLFSSPLQQPSFSFPPCRLLCWIVHLPKVLCKFKIMGLLWITLGKKKHYESFPGRTLARNRAHTGLWSEVRTWWAELYILQQISFIKRDLNKILSVYAGVRLLLDESKLSVPGSYLYVGGNVIGPSWKSLNAAPENKNVWVGKNFSTQPSQISYDFC